MLLIRFAVAVLVTISAAALMGAPTGGKGGGMLFEEFSRMSPTMQSRMVSKYVSRNGQGYWEVRQFRYLVRTKTTALDALLTALFMDDFHSNFSKVFGNRFYDSMQHEIYVFAGQAEYNAFLKFNNVPARDSCGVFIPSLNALAAFQQGSQEQTFTTLLHEGTHQILQAYAVGKNIPIWLNEGLAVNFETWDSSKKFTENIRLSILNSQHRFMLTLFKDRASLFDLKRLIEITHEQWNATERPEMNYLLAWSFVNYLLNTPEGQPILGRLMSGIMLGMQPRQILSDNEWSKLQSGWRNDVENRISVYERFIAPALDDENKKQTQSAIATLTKGVEAYPGSLDLKFYRGSILLTGGRYEEALKDFLTLEKQESQFPEINLRLSETYLGLNDIEQARTYAQKYIRKNRNDQTARDLLRKIAKANASLRKQESKN